MTTNEATPVYCGDGCGTQIGVRLADGKIVLWHRHHGHRHETTIKAR